MNSQTGFVICLSDLLSPAAVDCRDWSTLSSRLQVCSHLFAWWILFWTGYSLNFENPVSKLSLIIGIQISVYVILVQCDLVACWRQFYICLFPTLCSVISVQGKLEIYNSGSIYTTEIVKCYKSKLSLLRKSIVRHLPAYLC